MKLKKDRAEAVKNTGDLDAQGPTETRQVPLCAVLVALGMQPALNAWSEALSKMVLTSHQLRFSG